MARNDLIILQRGSQGLRSLLRTPGLVGAYFPWMDVVGRNILPVGSEDFQTGWGGGFIPTISGPDAEGWYSISWGSGNNSKYWRSAISPCASNALGAIEVQVLSGAFALGDAAARVLNINATNYGSPTVIPYTAQLYAPLSTLFFSILTWDYGGCSMKIRYPQLNLGQLYDYSAPVGLSQSVVDRSGLGNTVQNGATSGEDASDFAWSHVSAYFDGVDDVIANEPVADYALYAWGATNSAFGWVSEIPATAGYWFGGIRMSRTPGASEEARLKACIATILAGQGVSLA